MTDSNKKKLSPLTQRFADHLSDGVEYFGAEFASFDPFIATHVDTGVGLMISQVRCKGSNLPNSRKEKALRKKTMNDSSHYSHLIQQLRGRDDPETLWRVYIGLQSCITILLKNTDHYSDLITAIYVSMD